MILPKGEVVHQGLSTVYTDTNELLSTLMSSGFAGAVEVALPGNKGTFFISSGATINAVIEGDNGEIVTAGQEAIQKLVALSRQEEGTLSVTRLTAAEVEFAASPFGSEIIHKGLSTNFVKLDRFIQKLKEERHNGFIEVFAADNTPLGNIYLKEGELIGFTTASSGNTLTEPEAIPAFLGEISRQGATFNVHQTVFGISQKTAPKAKEPSSMKDIFPTKEPAPPRETTFVLAEPSQPKDVSTPKESSPTKEPFVDKEAEMDAIAREIFTEEPAPQPVKGEQDIIREEKESLEKGWVAVNKDRNGRNEVVLATQKILSKVEQFVDGSSQKGAFQRVFKNTLIEKSDLYPFLDPFAGQFYYNDGKITLDEEVDLDKFSMGIADCFSLTLFKIKREFPKAMTLPVGLKAEIESSLKYYQDLADHGETE